ncbi:MAG: hypothetical protein EOO14_08025, partial [Chitinophagaceae bacterium]
MKDLVPSIFGMSDELTTEIVLILTKKDYTSEALSFLKNHSRTLNYWGEGEENLLPGESPGHHRFSFHDLVWLGIVKELRDFGVSKSNIFRLKQEFLSVLDNSIVYEKLIQDKDSAEAFFTDAGFPSKDARELIEFLAKNKSAFIAYQHTFLLTLINNILFLKSSLYLLVNKSGESIVLQEKELQRGLSANREFYAFYKAPHISVHLNSIIGFFLSKDYIQDSLKETVLTKDEWKIIQTIRKEKPDSIEVKFSVEGKVESLEVTKLKKVQLEAR